jgi:hypothetical protein
MPNTESTSEIWPWLHSWKGGAEVDELGIWDSVWSTPSPRGARRVDRVWGHARWRSWTSNGVAPSDFWFWREDLLADRAKNGEDPDEGHFLLPPVQSPWPPCPEGERMAAPGAARDGRGTESVLLARVLTVSGAIWARAREATRGAGAGRRREAAQRERQQAVHIWGKLNPKGGHLARKGHGAKIFGPWAH